MPVIATAGTLNNNTAGKNLSVPKYAIGRSLRFRSSASAYLSRTIGSPSTTTNTISVWVKRGSTINSAYNPILACTNSNSILNFQFPSSSLNDTIQYVDNNTSILATNAVHRDPSAWYHIVFVWDTTNATTANRLRLYVNGIQVSSFNYANYPAQNTAQSLFTSGNTWQIGSRQFPGALYFDGYMAEFVYVDGQALTAASFGEFDVNGNWQPKKYTGTYGTNGFYLPFNNTASIGTDSSGNGNNWTNNNLNTATANTTYDSMIDSPTSYNDGTVYGRGNYATLNPLNRSTSSLPATLADGNLKHTTTSSGAGSPGSFSYSTSTHAMQSGKYYAEFLSNYASGSAGTNKVGLSNNFTFNYNGGNYIASNFTSAYTQQPVGTVVQIAYDADAGLYWIGTNGTFTGNPAAGTGGTSLVAPAMFFVEGYNDSVNRIDVNANFGQRPFTYTPPTGFKALNTFNLPAPPIPNPEAHFKTTLWTGTGSNQAISNRNANTQVSFSPALVWNKSRGGGFSNILTDVVRGFPLPFRAQLFTDNTAAEEARTDRLQSFDTEGFTVGSYQDVNLSANTFVGWQWKGGGGGGSNVTNNNGSVTSTINVNQKAGFSVVTYTEPASGSYTVGHGLGVAPSFVMLKERNVAGNNWVAWHNYWPAPTNRGLYPNGTNAAFTTGSNWLNSTTSSTFGMTVGQITAGSYNIVAYCWAAIPGYSAFGSYTGNGSTDGPFIYTGFRPRWLLIKRSSSTSDWILHDTSRSPYNLTTTAQTLAPNISDAEGSVSFANDDFDMLSNGFKMRNIGGAINFNGDTYIYAAFAEMPFKYARAR